VRRELKAFEEAAATRAEEDAAATKADEEAAQTAENVMLEADTDVLAFCSALNKASNPDLALTPRLASLAQQADRSSCDEAICDS
jgi:hypothetical protein